MTEIDADRLKQYQFLVFSKLEGAVTAGMVHLGDRLGLYRALAASAAPMTPGELAAAARLDERWVREWAYNQAAAKLIESRSRSATSDVERFSLTPEAAAVLASPDHEAFGMGMFHRLPQTMARSVSCPRAFRSGLGHDYDSHGPEGAAGIERSFEPWNRAHLVADVLPALDGVADKLAAGGTTPPTSGAAPAAPCCSWPSAFPASTFAGYDISQLRPRPGRGAAGRARAHQRVVPRCPRRPAAVGRLARPRHDVRLHPRHDRSPGDDARDPAALARRRHLAARRHQGAWTRSSENVAKNPMASLMYGISVLSCMSSALSEPRRRRARHARPVAGQGRGDGPRGRVQSLPQAARRPRRSTRSTRCAPDRRLDPPAGTGRVGWSTRTPGCAASARPARPPPARSRPTIVGAGGVRRTSDRLRRTARALPGGSRRCRTGGRPGRRRRTAAPPDGRSGRAAGGRRGTAPAPVARSAPRRSGTLRSRCSCWATPSSGQVDGGRCSTPWKQVGRTRPGRAARARPDPSGRRAGGRRLVTGAVPVAEQRR